MTDNRYRDFEEGAEEMSRSAGALLMRYFGGPLQVDYKGEVDLVTQADRESESLLIDRISTLYPEHAVLAEEGGGSGGAARFRWLIDPLDGTTNFAHDYPFFAVSMALEEAEPGREGEAGRRGPIVAAAVFDPTRGDCWTASRGGGARFNGQPVRVSRVDRMRRALAVTGFPYDIRENPQPSLDMFAAFLKDTQAVRRDGSAALNLCYLACGRFDVFWELKLHAWDTAAASLIIEEAGGVVSDFRGGPFNPFDAECAASNGLLHQQLLDTLSRFPRTAWKPGESGH
jgi:myo-inositol-1(or 4)-monophosphatase